MRTGRGAAVGVVAEGVDVHATLGIGIVASEVPGDGGRGGLGSLLEGDGAGHLGVTTDDSDYTVGDVRRLAMARPPTPSVAMHARCRVPLPADPIWLHLSGTDKMLVEVEMEVGRVFHSQPLTPPPSGIPRGDAPRIARGGVGIGELVDVPALTILTVIDVGLERV